MELELGSEVSAGISAVAADWERPPRDRRPRDRHCTALIVRVYHRACLNDRPVCRACEPSNWTTANRPPELPDQSTLSRRTRRADLMAFLQRLGERLNGRNKPSMVKRIDGKALELPNHTGAGDATWSRGVSRTNVGYKIHAIYSENPMPDAFAITSLAVCEKQRAARSIKRTEGYGYLLADAHSDASRLFDRRHEHNHQPLCPRAGPGTGQGHHYVSPHRTRAIEMPETPEAVADFGRALYRRRSDLERRFAQLVSFGAGLGPLPTWVRRIWRVRHWVMNWVMNKLLINAARIRINRRTAVRA